MSNSNKSRHVIRAAIFSSALLVAGFGHAVWAQTATAAAPPKPAAPAAAQAAAAVAPRIIVIDRNKLLQTSSAGKDMFAQAQNLTKAADVEFKAAADQLQKDGQALQQQLAILAPDVRAQKQKDFVARQQALQDRVTERQNQIQGGFAKAGAQLDMALFPILQQIMRERGANMMLERTAVIIATADFDITQTAIDRLDKALPHVKVELTKAMAPGAAPGPAPVAAK